MWVIANYQPTSFFSLRPYTATSSGGKSLIVPTAFAIKMALLDVAIRTQGLARGQELFSAIRDLQVAVRPPRQIVVINTFAKIWRINDSVSKQKATKKDLFIAKAKEERKWPYQPSIGFREYVQFGGLVALAFHGMDASDLVPLLEQINYLGKRGGFVQLLCPPEEADMLPNGFTMLTESVKGPFPLGMLQMVDDWGSSLTFERANVYSRQKIRVGQDRIFHHVVLPHRPVRFSRGFTLYVCEE